MKPAVPLVLLGVLGGGLLVWSQRTKSAHADSSDARATKAGGAAHEPSILMDRASDPPPVRTPPNYEVAQSPLLTLTELSHPTEAGATAEKPASAELRVRAALVHPLRKGTLEAGKWYRVVFKARGPAGSKLQVVFRDPRKNSFRTFAAECSGSGKGASSLEFQAPVFTEFAELRLVPASGELIVSELSVLMAPPRSRTEPVRSFQNSYVPAGYELVFNDEFNGKELDRRAWFTRYIYGGETLDHLVRENQRYTDGASHVVSGGQLHLVASKKPLSDPKGINYESGMIRSDFTYRYGFIEARVKMPGGLGVWPAFWLNSDVSASGRLEHPPEIDMFELVNNGKDDKVDMLHIASSAAPGQPNRFLYMSPEFVERHKTFKAPFRFDQGFHTIGSEWTPTTLTTYVDGKPVVSTTFRWVYEDAAEAGPAHVLLNLAIGGDWAGRYGIDDKAFPQSLDIDWVRVYQKGSL